VVVVWILLVPLPGMTVKAVTRRNTTGKKKTMETSQCLPVILPLNSLVSISQRSVRDKKSGTDDFN